MKKLLSILLVIMMIVLVTGCNKGYTEYSQCTLRTKIVMNGNETSMSLNLPDIKVKEDRDNYYVISLHGKDDEVVEVIPKKFEHEVAGIKTVTENVMECVK